MTATRRAIVLVLLGMACVAAIPTLAIVHTRMRFLVGTAVEKGDIAAVKRLTAVNPWLVNTRFWNDLSGTPILHGAVDTGNLELVQLMIDRGADVNARREWYVETPLHRAAEGADPRMVELLLDNGAEIDARNTSGETALLYAAREGSVRSVIVLIEHGAEIDATDNAGGLPIDYAADGGHKQVVQVLERHGAYRIPEVHRAAALGELDGVRTQVARDQAAVSRVYKGRLPLHYAARNGHAEVVQLLLVAGAGVDTKWDGKTPLYLAVINAHTEVMKVLIEHGADVNSDAWGLTPLHRAVMDRNLELVNLLLAHGADPNGRKVGQPTPLHDAVLAGDIAATMALLAHGADASVADFTGCTALDIAEERLQDGRGNRELVHILRTAGSPPQ